MSTACPCEAQAHREIFQKVLFGHVARHCALLALSHGWFSFYTRHLSSKFKVLQASRSFVLDSSARPPQRPPGPQGIAYFRLTDKTVDGKSACIARSTKPPNRRLGIGPREALWVGGLTDKRPLIFGGGWNELNMLPSGCDRRNSLPPLRLRPRSPARTVARATKQAIF